MDWSVKKVSWRLGEEAWNRDERTRTGREGLGAEHPLLETGERHREHPLLEPGVEDGRCDGGKVGAGVVGAGAKAEVVVEPGVGERGLAALVVVESVVAWKEWEGEEEESTLGEEECRPTAQPRIRRRIPLCRRELYREGLGANQGRGGARVRGFRRQVDGRRGGRMQ